ncbi:DUF6538 domain-containing protein [Phenylobacterium aquaticum]|uniref:DUF6538 domain-containing protein n=1 Tax=Phenylobacterium aquaticum TaxID=1763816 RepID=UPI00350E4271
MRPGGLRPRHLLRRGAVYAVRFRIPSDLADALGMVELQKSLHTTAFGDGVHEPETRTQAVLGKVRRDKSLCRWQSSLFHAAATLRTTVDVSRAVGRIPTSLWEPHC